MADTIADTIITTGTWLDVYASTGISAGTAVTVINKGSNPFFLAVKSSAPAVPTTGMPLGVPVYPLGMFSSSVNIPTGASGLWAFCVNKGNATALVQV